MLEKKLKEGNTIREIKRKSKKAFLPFLISFSSLSFNPEPEKAYIARDYNQGIIESPEEIHNNNDAYSYSELEEITTPKWTINGRIQRAERFSQLFERAENKYGIEENLLKAIAIQESYGDPMTRNSTFDGGVGIMQMQPGVAQEYGLETYGESNRVGQDFNHGRKIEALVEKKDQNLEKLAELDERFDPEKSINAAAELVRDLYEQTGDWNRTLLAYRRGLTGSRMIQGNLERFPDVRNIRMYQAELTGTEEEYLAFN